jgi:hypothetical protein
LLRCDAASSPLHTPIVPKPVADLEELAEHLTGGTRGTYAKSRNLHPHHVVVGQYPATQQVEKE